MMASGPCRSVRASRFSVASGRGSFDMVSLSAMQVGARTAVPSDRPRSPHGRGRRGSIVAPLLPDRGRSGLCSRRFLLSLVRFLLRQIVRLQLMHEAGWGGESTLVDEIGRSGVKPVGLSHGFPPSDAVPRGAQAPY